MEATKAVKEAIWLKGLVAELSLVQLELTLRCDSQSVIHLIKNQRLHGCTKHIDVRFHFIRDVIEEGVIKVEKIITNDNVADMFTKIFCLPSLHTTRTWREYASTDATLGEQC
ncbi:hypothetical protein MTR67_013774 [Solanum verrucosum]|uniref:Uncharacterized protein n=1 Tax=Solanum verrucosum TaxID=315347 RepID=A0AAF0QI74_SOLVR|nr:hypothetical protein MTR67_013774 [Solanum verrucosum]